MEIIWSYVLIAIITLVLITIRMLNNKIVNDFLKEHETAEKYVIFKKDFFFTVAKICVVCTILINGLTLYGHQRMNTQSIVLTFLIIGMCLISCMSFVAVDENKAFNIAGYLVEEDAIKDIQIKEHKNRLTCKVLFKEEINGYQGMEFCIFGQKREAFINKVEQ